MNWISVSSSQINKISYDEEKQELRVEFKRGGVYSYSSVTEEVYNEFVASTSPGSYFAENIKFSYEYKKV
jgi:hypothetical protein